MWFSAITLCLSDFIMFEKFMISFIAWFIIIESTKKRKEKKWTFASECFKGCLWNYAYNCMGRAAFEELAWVGREQSGEGGREGWLIWIELLYMLLILKSGCHHYVVYSQIIEFLFSHVFWQFHHVYACIILSQTFMCHSLLLCTSYFISLVIEVDVA